MTTLSASLASFTAIPASLRPTPAEAIAARNRTAPTERSALLTADESHAATPDPAHAAQFAGSSIHSVHQPSSN